MSLTLQDTDLLQFSDEERFVANDFAETRTTPPEGGAAEEETPHGVKRRLAKNSACDRCRSRKSKCDGNFPCAFCAARDGICIYSDEPPAKRAKKSLPLTSTTSAPYKKSDVWSDSIPPLANNNTENNAKRGLQLTKERAMMSAYAREYYIDLYMRQLMRCIPIFGPATSVRIAAVMPDTPNTLAYNMTMAMAARAVGHVSIAAEIYKSCHNLAASMLDNFTDKTASGFMLMGLYLWGEDNILARHNFAIASSIARQCNVAKNPKAPSLVTVCEEGHLLSKPDRPFFGERLTDVAPFQSLMIHYDMMKDMQIIVKHAFLEELLDRARTWPVNSTYMDHFCRMRLVTRHPIDARTDALLPLDRTMLMLRCIQHEDETLKVARRTFLTQSGATPSEFRLVLLTAHVALTGMRCMVCTMGGLVELGCYFAREGIETLERFTASHYGFSHNHIALVVISIANFVCLYKRNPFNEALDYRACLLRLVCTIQGLSHFKIIEDIIKVIEAELNDETDRSPAPMQPLAGEVLPEAAWLKRHFPDLDTITNMLVEVVVASQASMDVDWNQACIGVKPPPAAAPCSPLEPWPLPGQDADPETARAMDYDESIYGNIDFLRQQTASVNTTAASSSTLAGAHTDETRTASTEPMTPASPMHLHGGVGSVHGGLSSGAGASGTMEGGVIGASVSPMLGGGMDVAMLDAMLATEGGSGWQ